MWTRVKQNYPASTDDLKTIFIHIPKTAGTSIYDLIGYTYIGHVPYSWYKNRDIEKFNTYFKFAVVRNPWDRLVSTYFYLKQGGSNAMDQVWANKNLSSYSSFDQFVKQWLNKENINSWMHFIPQFKFIYDESMQRQVDYIARFENLSEDFSVISNKLELHKSLPHINASKRKPYQHYYNEQTRTIVAEVYKEDIELLGYQFEQSTHSSFRPSNHQSCD